MSIALKEIEQAVWERNTTHILPGLCKSSKQNFLNQQKHKMTKPIITDKPYVCPLHADIADTLHTFEQAREYAFKAWNLYAERKFVVAEGDLFSKFLDLLTREISRMKIFGKY